MAALVCDICGGKLVMQSGGVARCDSCGMEYTKERIQEKVQEIKGTVKIDGPVETVKGDAEKERLLNMANDCLNKGRLEEARRIYTTVSKEYSNDWRGWWGVICSTPKELQKLSLFQTNSGLKIENSLKNEYKNAIIFAPEEEKAKIRKIEHSNLIQFLKQELQKENNHLKALTADFNALVSEKNFYIRSNICAPIIFIIVLLAFIKLPFLSAWWLTIVIPICLGLWGAIISNNLTHIGINKEDPLILREEQIERYKRNIQIVNKSINDIKEKIDQIDYK